MTRYILQISNLEFHTINKHDNDLLDVKNNFIKNVVCYDAT